MRKCMLNDTTRNTYRYLYAELLQEDIRIQRIQYI